MQSFTNLIKSFSLFCSIALLVASCAHVREAEEEILTDATPPAGYNPIFIHQIKPFNPDSLSKPSVVVSGVDTRQPNLVKARIHIVDGNKTYLTGAAGSIYKNIWCFVADSFAGNPKEIVKYKIREATENEKQPVSIALVADHSGSMGDWRAEEVQMAFYKLINTKKDEDAFSIIKYDQKVTMESPVSTNKDEILRAFRIEKLKGYGGMTAISNGILEGLNSLKSATPNSQRAVVVFTDGWDNSSTVQKDSIIRLAKAMNTPIFAIDFGENINQGFMKQYSDQTGGFYHHIYSTEEFKLVFDDIYTRLKNSYILEYNPQEYGYHNLKIKLCLPKDSLTAEVNFDNTPDLGAIGLLNIYFDFDKATIKKESEESLVAIYSLMKGFPNMAIEIRGHTDNKNGTTDPEYNRKLSQKRADAVKAALVKKGIADTRIASKGYGETVPVADNSTDEGRALNRRTEFVVVKK